MRSVECVLWMVNNPRKRLEAKELDLDYVIWYDELQFYCEYINQPKDAPTNAIYQFRNEIVLEEYDWTEIED